ncbi:oxidoreductase [Rhizobium sp. Rhizsp82]|uniref:oxidoreductase n=1 Tax=Rhizobium sp. Rhizsp82 TaxID=3243057 RepID=UPI0039B6282E
MTTEQQPIHSGFNAKSAARDVIAGIDLSGKIAIVTGGYSGIGVETTRALSEAGATVVVPVRTRAKAEANLAGIARVELAPLDLIDPEAIDRFAEGFLASGRPLHMLVNSAGVMASPLTRDGRGYEVQFSGNHLGHFQLTARLWPALAKARGARVVAVSSRGHRFAPVDFADPNFEKREYDKWKAYGQSKTANALFAVGLDERGKASGVRAFSVHPGAIITDLVRHLTDDDFKAFGITRHADGGMDVSEESQRSFKNVEEGAATSVWCATSPNLDGLGGVYCEDCDISPLVPEGHSGPTGVWPWACDSQAADRLWALSERLTGCSFTA